MAAGLTWDEDGGEELVLLRVEEFSFVCVAVVVVVVAVAVVAELCMSSRNRLSLASDLAFLGREEGTAVELLFRSRDGYSEYLVLGSTSWARVVAQFTLVEVAATVPRCPLKLWRGGV